MKKKHRDIVVDGVTYGWIADGNNHVKLFKDRKVFVEYDIEYHHDGITPRIVAALIKDSAYTLAWLNAEPCPFCGKTVEPSQHSDYMLCVHEDDCWLKTGPEPITSIHESKLNAWNKRH